LRCDSGEVRDDRRWEMLESARSQLCDVLAPQGVTEVRYISWFPMDGVAVWLCTSTDAQRNDLGSSSPARETVRTILLACGLRDRDLDRLTTTAQSQETVDRDYEGSWFYAMR